MDELGDLLGTVRKHKANYRRLVQDMKDFRVEHNLEEGFSDRLAHAKELVRNLVPIRCVDLSMAKKIAKNEGVYSLRSAVEEGLAPENSSGRATTENDIDQGLDRFIYAGFGRAIFYGKGDYGEIPIMFQHDVMVKEDTLCVPRDFLYFSADNIERYKKHIIRGRQFRDFTANVIATFLDNPAQYLTITNQTKLKTLWWVEFLTGPEVLLYDKVGLDDIAAIGVTKRQKTALEKVGMPSDKLVVLSKNPRFYEDNMGMLHQELYEISKAKAH